MTTTFHGRRALWFLLGLGGLLTAALIRGAAAEPPRSHDVLFWEGEAPAEPAKSARQEPRPPKTGSSPRSDPADAPLFAQRIRPLLAANCFRCHSHEAKKARGGLVVDSLAGLLKGGDTGPAVVPGAPEKSLLIRAIRQTDPDLKMPPGDKKLSAEQIELLARWIKQGAPAPATGTPATAHRGKITDEDRAWWAFQPVREPHVPAVANGGWSRNAIDQFIIAQLTAEGLKPSPPANRPALIRRVTFDLTGLPPTPAEVEAFVNDRAPDAYELLIDRLLASPQYGERWARHWLDLVRYAESDGFRLDAYRPQAWRYRDYVIRAFNEDRPYDRFVREQLAGDELAPDDPEALTATAFLRHTIYEYNQRDVRTQWSDMLNEVTDVTSDVFLGLGMSCARCHDHKFDPILQKDYFRLQAFFTPLLPRDDVPLATAIQRAEYQARLESWQARTADLRRQIEAIEAPRRQAVARAAIKKFPEDIQGFMLKDQAARAPKEEQLHQLAYRQVLYEFDNLDKKLTPAEKSQLAALRGKLAAFDRDRPEALPLGLTVTDVGPVAPPTAIPRKSEPAPIEPGFLEVLGASRAVIAPVPAAPHSTGRRAALARWLTQPENPLTTRVIVNRIWQYHFGRGLVPTASDFGRLGEKPSHPELLDWLARRFVRDGWSFKAMHRLIMTSATYRQSALAPAPGISMKKDPENRLLWRGGTRRLDAEQIRDAILAVTGELQAQAGGPGVEPSKPQRSVYTKALRNKRDPLLDVFDAPEGFTSTTQRNVTTTATQALLLFNGQQLQKHAQAFARRLVRDFPGGADAQVVGAYRLAYGRDPTTAERALALDFLRSQPLRIEAPARLSNLHAAALLDFCHALLNSNEFIYLD